MTVVDLFTDLVAEHGLTAVMAVLAVGCTAVWCLLGVVLHTLEEHRMRRAETRAIAALRAIAHGIADAEDYANNSDFRDAWDGTSAPKGGGNA